MEDKPRQTAATAAGQINQPTQEAAGMIGTARAAVEDAVAKAGREVTRGYEAAEELVEESAQCVGHYPFSSVAVAFGGGVLVGWLIARTQRERFRR